MPAATTLQSQPKSRRRKIRPGRRRFGFGSRKPVLALDVDGQMLRVVHIALHRGRPRVTRFAALQLEFPPGADPEDPLVMGGAIAQALRALKWTPTSAVMGVSRGRAVLRTLMLPAATAPGEIASMVHFQVAKDLPFPVADAVIDFKVHDERPPAAAESAEAGSGPGDSGSKVEVLVAAVKRDVVQFYLNIAEAAGFKLAALGLRSYANARCVQACNVIPPGEYTALVSLRPDEAIIDVLDNQFLVFSRGAAVKQPERTAPAEAPPPEIPADAPAAAPSDSAEPKPADAPQPAPPSEADGELDFVNAVTIEVVRSLHSFEGTAQRGRVTRVVVAGGTGREQTVVESLRNRITAPTLLLDPAEELGLDESDRIHAPGALAAFGLGLGVNDPEGLPFDFLDPKKPVVQGQYRRFKRVALAAAAAVALMATLGLRQHLIRNAQAGHDQVAAQLARERKHQPVYQLMQAQIRSVRDWTSQRRNWLDHYAYLSEVFPPSQDLYLTSLSVSGRGAIRLAVQARNGEIIAQLDRQLRAAGYQVNPLAINPSIDKFGYSFKTTVDLAIPDTREFKFPLRATNAMPSSAASNPTTP